MNILEEFWYGNIEPAEYDTSSNKEHTELLQLISRNEDKLLATMTDGWKISAASEAAEMSTGYLGLVINGKRNATRDMLIRVAVAIGATVEETQYLLKYSGYNPQYVRNKRDAIIWSLRYR